MGDFGRKALKYFTKGLYSLWVFWFALTQTAFAVAPGALPQGGTVVAGGGNISTPSPDHMKITQNSDRMAVNWDKFNIGEKAHVEFAQPSVNSVALNRVTGGDMSEIMGRLSSNGQLVLINPNGVVFGPNSVIDVGGIVVSTHNMLDKDFMAGGKYVFTADSEKELGSIINNSKNFTVRQGGLAAFVAPYFENNGLIQARLGNVRVGVGDMVAIDFRGDKLVRFAVTKPLSKLGKGNDQTNALINQKGTIDVDGGTAILTVRAAQGIIDNVINNEGEITARSATRQGGKIILDGGKDNGKVTVTGKLDVSSDAANQKGGQIKVLGKEIEVPDHAEILADGDQGGEILIGGDFQGKWSQEAVEGGEELAQDQDIYGLPATDKNGQFVRHGTRVGYNAQTLKVAKLATISARSLKSAKLGQDGGCVILWSDILTTFFGTVNVQGHKGGFVEISGKKNLGLSPDKLNVLLQGARGEHGTLLLDPSFLAIGGTAAPVSNPQGVTYIGAGNYVVSSINTARNPLNAADAGITATWVSGAVFSGLTGSVALWATNDIYIVAPISNTSLTSLTLNAAGASTALGTGNGIYPDNSIYVPNTNLILQAGYINPTGSFKSAFYAADVKPANVINTSGAITAKTVTLTIGNNNPIPPLPQYNASVINLNGGITTNQLTVTAYNSSSTQASFVVGDGATPFTVSNINATGSIGNTNSWSDSSAYSLLLSASTLNLGGSNVNFANGNINLTSTSGGITGTGNLAANTLTLSSAGAVSLTGANQVGILAGTAGGTFSFTNNQSLNIGTLSAPGQTINLTLSAPTYSINDSQLLTANTLNLTTNNIFRLKTNINTLNLTATSVPGTSWVDNSSSSGLTINTLNITNANKNFIEFYDEVGGGISVNPAGIAGDITTGNNNGATLYFNAKGNINLGSSIFNIGPNFFYLYSSGNVTGTGSLTTAGFGYVLGSSRYGGSLGTVSLTGANNTQALVIDGYGHGGTSTPTAADMPSSLSLTNTGQALTLPAVSTQGGNITINTGIKALTLSGALTANGGSGNISLIIPSITSTQILTAATLNLTSSGSVSLTGANQVGTIQGTASGGAFTYTSGVSLIDSLSIAGTSVSLTAPSIVLANTISATGNVLLNATAGNLSTSANSTITGASIEFDASGSILINNQLTLGSYGSPITDFILNAPTISGAGKIILPSTTTSNGQLQINQTTSTFTQLSAGSAVNLTSLLHQIGNIGNMKVSTLNLTSVNDVTTTGSISSPNGSISLTGNLVNFGTNTVNAGTGTLNLTSTGGGISGSGVLTANTLTLNSAGTVNLTGTNQISILQGSSVGSTSFTNGANLIIGSNTTNYTVGSTASPQTMTLTMTNNGSLGSIGGRLVANTLNLTTNGIFTLNSFVNNLNLTSTALTADSYYTNAPTAGVNIPGFTTLPGATGLSITGLTLTNSAGNQVCFHYLGSSGGITLSSAPAGDIAAGTNTPAEIAFDSYGTVNLGAYNFNLGASALRLYASGNVSGTGILIAGGLSIGPSSSNGSLGNVSLTTGANALTALTIDNGAMLPNTTPTPNPMPNSLNLTNTGGALTLPAISTRGGDITVNAAGQALTLNGQLTANSGNGSINLTANTITGYNSQIILYGGGGVGKSISVTGSLNAKVLNVDIPNIYAPTNQNVPIMSYAFGAPGGSAFTIDQNLTASTSAVNITNTAGTLSLVGNLNGSGVFTASSAIQTPNNVALGFDANALSFGTNTVNVGTGALNLNTIGAISGTGVITAGSLTATAGGAITLNANNAVNSFSATAGGAITFNNGTALTLGAIAAGTTSAPQSISIVAGPITGTNAIAGGSIVFNSSGGISLTGGITATSLALATPYDELTLASSGSAFTLSSVSNISSGLSLQGPSVNIAGALNGIAGVFTANSNINTNNLNFNLNANAIALGTYNINAGTGALNLSVGVAGNITGTGAITASSLYAQGNVVALTGPNMIGSLSGQALAGAFTFVNNKSLTLSGVTNNGGAISVTAPSINVAGNIVASSGGGAPTYYNILLNANAGTLSTSANATITGAAVELDATQSISISNLLNFGTNVNPITSLTLNAPSISGSGTIILPGTATTNGLFQVNVGTPTFTQLTAGSSVNLTSTQHQIANLGILNLSNMSLTSTSPITAVGAISSTNGAVSLTSPALVFDGGVNLGAGTLSVATQGGGSYITFNTNAVTAGGLSLTTPAGGAVTLNSSVTTGGTLSINAPTVNGGGVIAAGSLNLNATGNVTVNNNNNTIGTLGGTVGGNLNFANNSTLNLSGLNVVGNATIQNNGNNVSISGTVQSGNTLTLSGGILSPTIFNALTADTLNLTTSGIENASDNIDTSINTLNLTVFGSQSFNLYNFTTTPLSIGSINSTGNQSIEIFNINETLTLNGAINAPNNQLMLIGQGDVTLNNNAITTGPLTLQANGNITGGGVITASGLTVQTLDESLGSVNLSGANNVGSLTIQNATGAVSVTNTGGALTINGISTTNSNVTVDATGQTLGVSSYIKAGTGLVTLKGTAISGAGQILTNGLTLTASQSVNLTGSGSNVGTLSFGANPTAGITKFMNTGGNLTVNGFDLSATNTNATFDLGTFDFALGGNINLGTGTFTGNVNNYTLNGNTITAGTTIWNTPVGNPTIGIGTTGLSMNLDFAGLQALIQSGKVQLGQRGTTTLIQIGMPGQTGTLDFSGATYDLSLAANQLLIYQPIKLPNGSTLGINVVGSQGIGGGAGFLGNLTADIQSAGPVALGTSQISDLSVSSLGGALTLANAQGMTISNLASGNNNVTITNTGITTVGGAVNVGTGTFAVTGGSISDQGTHSTITAGIANLTANAQASSAVSLLQSANIVPIWTGSSNQGYQFSNSVALTASAITASGLLNIQNPGQNISLTGGSAGTMTLNGAVITGSGFTANTLNVVSTGAVTIGGAVASANIQSMGAVTLTSTQALSMTGLNSNNNTTTITAPTSIGLTGLMNVGTGTLTLNTDAVNGANATLTAGTLALNTTDNVDLGANPATSTTNNNNSVGILGGTVGGNLFFNNNASLAIHSMNVSGNATLQNNGSYVGIYSDQGGLNVENTLNLSGGNMESFGESVLANTLNVTTSGYLDLAIIVNNLQVTATGGGIPGKSIAVDNFSGSGSPLTIQGVTVASGVGPVFISNFNNINTIVTGGINVGSNPLTFNIYGPLNLGASAITAGATTMNTSGAITGTGTLSLGGLTIGASSAGKLGAISLTGANNIGSLSISGAQGPVTVTNTAAALSVGGITATGNITLNTGTQNMGINGAVTSSAGTLALSGKMIYGQGALTGNGLIVNPTQSLLLNGTGSKVQTFTLGSNPTGAIEFWNTGGALIAKGFSLNNFNATFNTGTQSLTLGGATSLGAGTFNATSGNFSNVGILTAASLHAVTSGNVNLTTSISNLNLTATGTGSTTLVNKSSTPGTLMPLNITGLNIGPQRTGLSLTNTGTINFTGSSVGSNIQAEALGGGNIQIAAPLSASGEVTLAGAAITGSGPITSSSLNLTASSNVSLTGNNNVGSLSIMSNGAVAFTNQGGSLTINGIDSGNNSVVIDATGQVLSVARYINAGTGAMTLKGATISGPGQLTSNGLTLYPSQFVNLNGVQSNVMSLTMSSIPTDNIVYYNTGGNLTLNGFTLTGSQNVNIMMGGQNMSLGGNVAMGSGTFTLTANNYISGNYSITPSDQFVWTAPLNNPIIGIGTTGLAINLDVNAVKAKVYGGQALIGKTGSTNLIQIGMPGKTDVIDLSGLPFNLYLNAKDLVVYQPIKLANGQIIGLNIGSQGVSGTGAFLGGLTADINSVGGVSLSGTNQLSLLAASLGGNLSLENGQDLIVSNINGGSSSTINLNNNSYGIIVGGEIQNSSGSMTLAGGSIQEEGAHTAVNVETLDMTAEDEISFVESQNNVGTLGATAGGAVSFVNNQDLTVTGLTSGGAMNLLLGANGLTLTGPLTATANPISITADNFTLNGQKVSGQTVALAPYSRKSIGLANSGSDILFTVADLKAIIARTLTLGSLGNTEAVTIGAADLSSLPTNLNVLGQNIAFKGGNFSIGANKTLTLTAHDSINPQGVKWSSPTITTKGPNGRVVAAAGQDLNLRTLVARFGGITAHSGNMTILQGDNVYVESPMSAGGTLVLKAIKNFQDKMITFANGATITAGQGLPNVYGLVTNLQSPINQIIGSTSSESQQMNAFYGETANTITDINARIGSTMDLNAKIIDFERYRKPMDKSNNGFAVIDVDGSTVLENDLVSVMLDPASDDMQKATKEDSSQEEEKDSRAEEDQEDEQAA
jgi:filamentous hemagglutinin family protein